MGTKIHRVAIVGCGRLGQYYAEAYSTYPDTEIAAIAEFNPERRDAVGKRFGVEALYPDVHSLLQDIVPDIVAVVTPTRYYKEAVIACAEAGVKGVSTDKPIAAVLSDADEMVEACESRGVVYAGGNLPRAMNEVQEAARMLRSGEFGKIIGASVQGWGVEISGAGCQYISVMRLLADTEVEEVIAWAAPQEVLDGDSDDGLAVHAKLRLTNGVECAVFGHATSFKGVDVWSADSLVRWKWGPPELYKGFNADGARRHLEHNYAPYQWSEYSWLTGSIRSFLAAVEMGTDLGVSGHDLRQALEVAIAAKLSARLGNVPIKLPLVDRSLSLYPTEYRWSGGDATGRPQSIEEAAGPPHS